MKKKILAILITSALFVGCSGSKAENGSEVTTENAAVTEAVSETASEEATEAVTENIELSVIDDNTIYVYPSSDQLTPTQVTVTDEEAIEILGFVNSVEKQEGTIESDSNIYFKSKNASVNIASYDNSVNVSGMCGNMKADDMARFIEIIKTESGVDLTGYLD